jgi:hypothetical protein
VITGGDVAWATGTGRTELSLAATKGLNKGNHLRMVAMVPTRNTGGRLRLCNDISAIWQIFIQLWGREKGIVKSQLVRGRARY